MCITCSTKFLLLCTCITCSQEKLEFLKVHASKEKAEGKQVVVLPLVIFSDETSGNTTKKWNRIETYSMVMAGLPQREARKFENIHLLTASNIVNSSNLGQALAKDLKGNMNYKTKMNYKTNNVRDINIYINIHTHIQ